MVQETSNVGIQIQVARYMFNCSRLDIELPTWKVPPSRRGTRGVGMIGEFRGVPDQVRGQVRGRVRDESKTSMYDQGARRESNPRTTLALQRCPS